MRTLNYVRTKSVFSYTQYMTSGRLNALKVEQPLLIIKASAQMTS